MKVSWRHLERNKACTLSITPEDADDIWQLYNLIAPGDIVECLTMRKIINESASGAVDTQKRKLVLAVNVEKINVDLKSATMRINGRNVKENEHVKLGSYHTLDIEVDRYIKLSKDVWDSLSIQLLRQAANPDNKVDVAAVVLQEGLAQLCVISSGNTKVYQKIEANLPKKRFGATSQMEKVVEKFYTQIIEAMLTHFKFASLKAIVLASPATFKDDLHKKLFEYAVKEENRVILDAKAKFLKVVCSSGQISALNEVLQDPRVAALLANTKMAQEAKAMEQFKKALTNSSEMVTYGLPLVLKAADHCAIKILLLSDTLFRSCEVAQRRRYGDLVEEVKHNGGSVLIFSAETATDKDLADYAGVAAILNFPIEFE